MKPEAIARALTIACVALLATACADQPTPTATDAAPDPAATAAAASLAPAMVAAEPFLVRATLDPYFINQMPELMFRSRRRSDLVIQRLVSAPGVGGWHTHRGPSFGIVEEGLVMITNFVNGRCVDAVYGPGDAYFEVANQVHRVTILGIEQAVEYKARFNTPIGGGLSDPAGDPGC